MSIRGTLMTLALLFAAGAFGYAQIVDEANGGKPRVADAAAAVPDEDQPIDEPVEAGPATTLIDELAFSRLRAARDYVTGRLANSISETEIDLLAALRLETVRCLQRATDRLTLEGTTEPGREDAEPQRLRLRVVEVDGEWKLEHLRVLPVDGANR